MSGPFLYLLICLLPSFLPSFFRSICIPLGVLWTGCLSLFHLGFTSMSSSSLSDEWEEAYEELCSSTDSSLSESESSENQKRWSEKTSQYEFLINTSDLFCNRMMKLTVSLCAITVEQRSVQFHVSFCCGCGNLGLLTRFLSGQIKECAEQRKFIQAQT